jgi:regulatory protein
VITALTPRSGRADRVAVRLEGGRVLELATTVVDSAGLRTGDLLMAEEQERLLAEDAPHRARSRSLRLLALRDRSRREVELRLRKLGFDAEVVADTVEWLEGLGYLDDGRFAASYAEARLRAGWGEARVRAELKRAGVDRVLVERALEVDGPNSQAANGGADSLLAAARRRFGAQFAADPEAAERRLAGFLIRRGFDWEAVGRVARVLRLEAGTRPDARSGSGSSAGSGSGSGALGASWDAEADP